MKEVAFMDKDKDIKSNEITDSKQNASQKTKTEIESAQKKMMTIDMLLKKKFPKPKNALQKAFQLKLKSMFDIVKLQNEIKEISKKKNSERVQLKMSRHEYYLYNMAYKELSRKSEKEINKDTPHLRYKQMYIIPYEPGEWKDYNQHELHELKKRKALEDWIKEDDLLKKLIMEDEELDERFMNLLLLIADVKEKELAGTHEEESLGDILTYQRSLIKIMRDL